jgi:hypothetical protein
MIINKKNNLIILGTNAMGQTASSQRITNLFSPLLQFPVIHLSNLVINGDPAVFQEKKGFSVCKLYYNYRNPFSILWFFFTGILYFLKKFDKKSLNIIYHYGYPSIEDILFIKFCKYLGYKIVYDIVEHIKHSNQSCSSLRFKFKNWTSHKILKQLYKTGTLCFAISISLCKYLEDICHNKIPIIHLPISVDVEQVGSFKNIVKNLIHLIILEFLRWFIRI